MLWDYDGKVAISLVGFSLPSGDSLNFKAEYMRLKDINFPDFCQ